MGHKVPGFLLSCMSLKRQLKRRAAGEREEAVADEGAFLGEAAAAAAAAAVGCSRGHRVRWVLHASLQSQSCKIVMECMNF